MQRLRSYDAKGRLTQVVQTSTGSTTLFEYWTPTDALSDDFIKNFKRKKDAATYLTQEALAYDFWGNPTSLKDPDGTLTCLEFSAARGFLAKRTEAMAGQTNCTSPNSADLVTTWVRDTGLRIRQLTRPDGSCMFWAYNATTGTLASTKRRDDCIEASSGDSQVFIYNDDNLVTEIQTKDAAGTIKAKQLFSYYDSRRLQWITNPDQMSYATVLTYDNNGELSQVDGAGNLSKVVFHRDGTPGAEHRVTSVDKYKTASTFDAWNLLYDWIGNQLRLTDPDSKVTQTTRDDLGRIVVLESPDMPNGVEQEFDAGSRLTTKTESFGVTEKIHTFTYDLANRPLDSNYDVDGETGPTPEVVRVYDAPPVTCPISGGCNRTNGKLAYEKVVLFYDDAEGDGTLDQETFYSYDDAGRVIREYIRDDTGRIAEQQFNWTKNGALAQVTTPTGGVIGWSYGSAGSNSDTDRVTALWRTNTSSPVIDSILWNPYGPLQQYNQMNTTSGVAQRTRITRNLKYLIQNIRVETQTGATTLYQFVRTEDRKGRTTKRDYWPDTVFFADSYFLYDHSDRLLCETTTLVSTCPTSGYPKNSHSLSPPFTAAGDWKQLLRPIPGSTGSTHVFNPSGYGTSHQITTVQQTGGSPVFGDTNFTYNIYGDRISDNNVTQTNDQRDYFYLDGRHNVNTVVGQYKTGGTWYTYSVISAFDAKNRRVYKAFHNQELDTTASYFFYYDPLDRMTEVRYTPDTSVPTTYTLFQLFWLDDRLVLYWQTDYPSATTSRRYVGTDETNRPIDMLTWPSSGDSTRVWAINPSAWGMDGNITGPTVYQPILFAGQYNDNDTTAYLNNGTTVHRPGVVLNGFRTYDPFVGAYLQVDPLVDKTWSTYGYANSNPVSNADPDGLGYKSYDGFWWYCPDSSTAVEEGDVIVVSAPACEQLGLDWYTPPHYDPEVLPPPIPIGPDPFVPWFDPDPESPYDYDQCIDPGNAPNLHTDDNAECRDCIQKVFNNRVTDLCNNKYGQARIACIQAETTRALYYMFHCPDDPVIEVRTASVGAADMLTR